MDKRVPQGTAGSLGPMETRARSAQGLARAVLARVRRRPGRVTWQTLLAYLGCALVAALVALPVVAEQAVEDVRFTDELGTFPVEVSLCHDGRSTLDTEMRNQIYHDVQVRVNEVLPWVYLIRRVRPDFFTAIVRSSP